MGLFIIIYYAFLFFFFFEMNNSAGEWGALFLQISKQFQGERAVFQLISKKTMDLTYSYPPYPSTLSLFTSLSPSSSPSSVLSTFRSLLHRETCHRNCPEISRGGVKNSKGNNQIGRHREATRGNDANEPNEDDPSKLYSSLRDILISHGTLQDFKSREWTEEERRVFNEALEFLRDHLRGGP